MITWMLIILSLINLIRYLHTDNKTYLFFGAVFGIAVLLTDIYLYLDEKIKEITKDNDDYEE